MNEEKIIRELKKIVKRGDDTLGADSKDSFYELGLDRDGMPYSHGNSDDVYSDGFSNGELDGKYYLAKEILEMMGVK